MQKVTLVILCRLVVAYSLFMYNAANLKIEVSCIFCSIIVKSTVDLFLLVYGLTGCNKSDHSLLL